MSDWWTRHATSADWHRSYSHTTQPDWWMISGADTYGPELNAAIGTMDVGTDFLVGDVALGDAAVQTSLYVG